MPEIPFEIPKSLVLYSEQFDEDPVKATSRLEKQLQKRGPDAVGHFLLAWFYHLRDLNEQAVEEAVKAKNFAPGSPFLDKLHYYLCHPQKFDAWTPDISSRSQQRHIRAEDHGPVLNLDNLIEKLSGVESQPIQPDRQPQKEEPEENYSDDVDDIVSETLASIHEKQGKTEAAIQTYKRLKELNQEKRNHYNDQIKRLEKEREEQKEKQE